MRRRTFVRVGAAVLALGISMPALTAGALAQDAPVEITMLTMGDKPTNGRIAVKVINHLGDEVMKVFRV